MKNLIISAMGAYIFYGFCEVRHIIILFAAFVLILEIIVEVEKIIKELKEEGEI